MAGVMQEKNSSYTYSDAGVSIAAGNALVKAIGPLVKATARPGADGEIGGFGGFFDPKAAKALIIIYTARWYSLYRGYRQYRGGF